MTAYRLGWFVSAAPIAELSPPTAADDPFLAAAPAMDMSRVGIATAMAYRAVPHCAAPAPHNRDRP